MQSPSVSRQRASLSCLQTRRCAGPWFPTESVCRKEVNPPCEPELGLEEIAIDLLEACFSYLGQARGWFRRWRPERRRIAYARHGISWWASGVAAAFGWKEGGAGQEGI